MDETVRIVLVDDQPVLRKGLRCIIDERQDMEVVGEAGSVEEALELCGKARLHLVLLDFSLQNGRGLELIKEVKELFPHLKVLVFTIKEEPVHLRRVLAAGSNGYLLKRATAEELVLAVRAVARGEVFIDSFMTGDLLRGVMGMDAGGKQANHDLSGRQKDILKMMARGYTDRQIAEKLFISIKTVESNKARIKEKLNLTERSELVQYALERYFY